ncbi:MAG: hypothetical protein O3A84_07310 [Proteobacteria bacterium]|nr:hypothetical protein [Pseudomonadota bacterium]
MSVRSAMAPRFWSLPVLLCLAACGTAANVETPTAEPTTQTNNSEETTARPANTLPAGEAAKLKPEIPIPQASLNLGDLRKQLLGQTGQQVQDLVGAPDFSRRDNPAEIWQYRSTDCRIDLFLYKSGPALKVEHVDVRGISIKNVSPEKCLSDLLRKRPENKTS